MKFQLTFNITALSEAVVYKQIEAIKLLLQCENIDVNKKHVSYWFVFIKFLLIALYYFNQSI